MTQENKLQFGSKSTLRCYVASYNKYIYILNNLVYNNILSSYARSHSDTAMLLQDADTDSEMYDRREASFVVETENPSKNTSGYSITQLNEHDH